MTHPDFFAMDSVKQDTNTRNIAALSRIVDAQLSDPSFDIRTSGYADTRSLTFYVKATEDMPNPRRVKVSTKELHLSLREILEDYDASLPSPPKGFVEAAAAASRSKSQEYKERVDGSKSPRHVSITETVAIEDIESFLDSLSVERAELLAWRRDRIKKLEQIKEQTQKILGCRNIEVRYSSSPQTNSVTFKKLLGVLLEKEKDMKLTLGQWQNLSIVLTFDDCTGDAVDPVEGEIKLSPAQVPLEWIDTLRSVREQTSKDALRHRLEIETLETDLTPILRGLCLQQIIYGQGIVDEKMQQSVRGGISLSLKRGNSCSKLSYKVFLTTLLEHIRGSNELSSSDISTQELPSNDQLYANSRKKCCVDSESERVGDNASSSIFQESSLISATDLWLSELPIAMSVKVESGHGSKVLPDGTIRIDSRALPEKLVGESGLLRVSSFKAVKDTAATQLRRRELKEKLDALVKKLELRSLERGVGVSEDEQLGFVQRISSYLEEQGGKKLRNLRGHAVQIGHRTGIDGATVLLPHLLLKTSYDEYQPSSS